MKKALFIMTHLGSGWEKLSLFFNKLPNFDVYQTGNDYNHPSDVNILFSKIHKKQNTSSIYVDVLFHNKNFTMKRMCEYYKFIFWSSSLEDSIEELVQKHKYKKTQAENYWSYRLNGLNEYHLRCKNSLWNPKLTEDTVNQLFN